MSAVDVPLALEAHEPPEVRGEGRDDVALLVARRHDLGLVHARFRELPRFLSAGDLLVVNVSATLPAALETRLGGKPLQLWLSTPTLDGTWLVELRTSDRRPFPRPPLPARLELPGGVDAELVARFAGQRTTRRRPRRARRATQGLPAPIRAAGPVRLRARAVAARCLPDRLRPRARERGDAERRPALHGGARDGARRARDAPCPRDPAHGRLLARARRAALSRAFPCAGHDCRAGQRCPQLGRARDRGRYDGRARA